MIKQKIFNRKTCAFLMVVLLLLELAFSIFSIEVGAEAKQYSAVLDDLERDSAFNAEEYPAVAGDTSLKLFQIAEGENGELFVYVYQPGYFERELRATYINMSLLNRTDKNPTYNLYSLTWLNNDGVFAKYLVNGFEVSDEEYRYYNIATVYRAFNEKIDDPAEESDDLDSHLGYSVGLCYCAYTYNNTVLYECEKVDVVDIEILAVGTVRYTEGFKLYVDKCDAHFVAFSVENFDVDKIFDATIVYTIQDYTWSFVLGVGESEKYGTPLTARIDISSKETGSNDGDGLFGVKYKWQRILTKDEFKTQLEDYKNENVVFSEGGLDSAEFVFQFLETDYTLTGGNGNTFENSKKVTDVGILRLHFLSEEKRYNLGVVSDLVSDDGKTDFEITIGDNFEDEDWWLKIIGLLLFVILYLLLDFLAKFIPLVRFLLDGVDWILKSIWRLLTLPFRLLWRLLRGK